MKGKIICFVATLVTGLTNTAWCGILFDVNFEGPTHINGSAPTTGIGSDVPTGMSGMWTVTNNFADSSSQVAAIYSPATGGGLGFSPGMDYTTGLHLISWDIAMENPSVQSSFQLFSLGSPTVALGINYFGDESITIYDPLNGSSSVGSVNLGAFFSLSVSFDLDAYLYGVSLDGSPLVQDMAITPGTDIYSVSLLNPFGSTTMAIDNFRWEIVPEPSTISLLLVGVAGMLWRRLRRG